MIEKDTEFICDDRGVKETIYKVQRMSDAEFEKYIALLKRKEKN